MKSQSPDKLFLGHLNINSIQFKFDGLKFITGNKIDIFLISEIKLDDSFPTAQFLIEDFAAPCTRDRNSKGGWLLLYIREDIRLKRLSCKTSYNIETLIVEINLKKRGLNGSYNPNKNQTLIYRLTYFPLSNVRETGLSDFRLLIVTEFKVGFT